MDQAWPEYCCAILRDGAGRYLLERRPPSARHAAGMLTCFGGRRLADEHPDECVRRELREELGFAAGAIERCARLLGHDGRAIAWFYRSAAPDRVTVLEPGVEAVWLAASELAGAPVSPWHRAALEAEREGREAVIVEG